MANVKTELLYAITKGLADLSAFAAFIAIVNTNGNDEDSQSPEKLNEYYLKYGALLMENAEILQRLYLERCND